MIKAVFLDFDGTLFSHKRNEIPDSAVRAIDTLRKNHIKVFLSSGRSNLEMPAFDLKGIQFDGCVYNNGQLVLDKENHIIFENPIEGKLKDILVNIFNEKLFPICFVMLDDIFINFVNDHVVEVQKKINTGVPPIGEYKNQTFYMCSAFINNENELDEYHIKDYGEVTFWQDGAVDVCPKNVSKLTGIKKVVDYLGIGMDETMAIGDGHNDMEMIKTCGIGICMGNGNEEVKKISDYVTTDIDEDGLYNACKHYGLI